MDFSSPAASVHVVDAHDVTLLEWLELDISRIDARAREQRTELAHLLRIRAHERKDLNAQCGRVALEIHYLVGRIECGIAIDATKYVVIIAAKAI